MYGLYIYIYTFIEIALTLAFFEDGIIEIHRTDIYHYRRPTDDIDDRGGNDFDKMMQRKKAENRREITLYV